MYSGGGHLGRNVAPAVLASPSADAAGGEDFFAADWAQSHFSGISSFQSYDAALDESPSVYSSAAMANNETSRGGGNRNSDKKRKGAAETPFPCSRAQNGKEAASKSGTNHAEADEKKGKEDSSDGGGEGRDYVHVRAKRGQATNSHSLAERLRRKKISERMKLLQDLVPGCNKITGKAVMLDEIINYVQSLQRQVEFLSMKLAAVNPELSFDLEQIVSKEIFLSQDRHPGLYGLYGAGGLNSYFGGGSSSLHGLTQAEMLCRASSSSNSPHQATIPHLSINNQIPGIWDGLQGVSQMDFNTDISAEGIADAGSMKDEE